MNQPIKTGRDLDCRLFVSARSAMAPCYPRYAVAVVNVSFIVTLAKLVDSIKERGLSHVAVPFPVEWDAQVITPESTELFVGQDRFFFRGYSPSDDFHIETVEIKTDDFCCALGQGHSTLFFGATLSLSDVYGCQVEEAYEEIDDAILA